MLSRVHRFHGYNSLRAVYRRGQTVRGPLMSLKYGQRGSDKPFRVGVVVSRKVSKSAVVRNRIRRRLYEIVRQNIGGQTTGYDLVLTAYDEQLATMPAADLTVIVSDLLQKAGLV